MIYFDFQGTTILQVTALDGDQGVPNDVQYSIIGGKFWILNVEKYSIRSLIRLILTTIPFCNKRFFYMEKVR